MIKTALFTAASSKFMRDALVVIGASLALGLVGPLAIPLPFTPVPIAFTVPFILFFAVCLGPKRASLAVIGYLIQGLMGLPVFAKGGSGLLHFMGPTGGYLIGYLVAAYATGKVAEFIGRERYKIFGAMLLGNFLIHLLGVLHLSQFLGFQKAVLLGCVPFIAVDLLKLVAASSASWVLRQKKIRC